MALAPMFSPLPTPHAGAIGVKVSVRCWESPPFRARRVQSTRNSGCSLDFTMTLPPRRRAVALDAPAVTYLGSRHLVGASLLAASFNDHAAGSAREWGGELLGDTRDLQAARVGLFNGAAALRVRLTRSLLAPSARAGQSDDLGVFNDCLRPLNGKHPNSLTAAANEARQPPD